MGRAIAADGVGTVLASAVGGSPTTTYAENIGVMAATRVYSTAAYYVAAVVAILLGLVPEVRRDRQRHPGGVLGGITLVLYGMIGLLGAKIWMENGVDFANPVNLVAARRRHHPRASATRTPSRSPTTSSLGGIALGTIVIVVGYHLARAVAPPDRRRRRRSTAVGTEATADHEAEP